MNKFVPPQPRPNVKPSTMEKRFYEAVKLGMPPSIGEPNVSAWRAAELWLAGYAAGKQSQQQPST